MSKVWYFVGGLIGAGVLGYFWFKNYSFSDKFLVKANGHYLKFNLFAPAQLEIYLDITSKLPVDVTIKGYNLDLFINENMIKNVESSQNQKLVKNEASRIVISTTFSPLKLTKNVANISILKEIISKPLQNYVQIKGSIDVEAVGLNFNKLPIDIKITLADFLNTSA
jgi:hypothetical protein